MESRCAFNLKLECETLAVLVLMREDARETAVVQMSERMHLRQHHLMYPDDKVASVRYRHLIGGIVENHGAKVAIFGHNLVLFTLF